MFQIVGNTCPYCWMGTRIAFGQEDAQMTTIKLTNAITTLRLTKSPHTQDNIMYWGIMTHDKFRLRFHTKMSLEDIGRLIGKVTPTQLKQLP